MLVANLWSYTSRSKNTVDFVSGDESTFFLRRCRSCGATVDAKALFGVGISGSGAEAETILLTKTKKEMLRERAVETYNLAQGAARKEVKKPSVSSGSFAHFSSCWEKWAAGGRPRARKREILHNKKPHSTPR